MHKKITTLLISIVVTVLAASSQGSERMFVGSFVPKNNMRIPVGSKEAKGLNEQQFNQVLDQIQAIYGPIVASLGGNLVINRLWTDETVNASAERDGNNYVLNMYGGLARHETITQDGFTLVACHEMGHHLGGAPKIGGMGWPSNEGQADYSANLKCLRRVFSSQGSKNFTRMWSGSKSAGNICAKSFVNAEDRARCEKDAADDNETARAACDHSFAKGSDKALCLRGAIAGLSVTELLRILSGGTTPAHFSTPDPSVVEQTNDEHPDYQCRLDTYYQGSLCPRPYTDPVDDNDPSVGSCTASQNFKVGLRPLCWYKPPTGAGLMADRMPALNRAAIKESKALSSLTSGNVWQGL